MYKSLLITLLVAIFIVIQARYEDRYDLSKLVVDLRPVEGYVGFWQLVAKDGNSREFIPPSQIDFSINPIPKFGSRALNITHTYLDSNKNIIRSDYGFMPVKNATRRDPRVHAGYLTTSSEGYSMMEQGTVQRPKITFHLKQFLRRTFDVGVNGGNLELLQFERQFELVDPRTMIMRVRAETGSGTEGFTARYTKIAP